MNETKQISSHASCFTVQCGRTFVGSATVTAHLPIKTDVGWLWVFEFDPFRWENRGGFTYTDQRPFEVLPPNKKKKKKKADLRRERGGFVRTPRTPLAYGPAAPKLSVFPEVSSRPRCQQGRFKMHTLFAVRNEVGHPFEARVTKPTGR